MSKLTIIDNFLPDDVFCKLRDAIFSVEFPWFYCEAVSIKPEDNDVVDPLAMETDGLHHIIYDPANDAISFTHDWFIPFYEELTQFGFNETHLLRARLSQKTPKVGFTENNYNIPHVDYHRPHETMIFYFNDSDGPTHIFDQRYTALGHKSGFTIKDKVMPKANRLVWIDGLQYHTAANPINSPRRVILNLNLECL